MKTLHSAQELKRLNQEMIPLSYAYNDEEQRDASNQDTSRSTDRHQKVEDRLMQHGQQYKKSKNEKKEAQKSREVHANRPQINEMSRQLAKEKQQREIKNALEVSMLLGGEQKKASNDKADEKANNRKKRSMDRLHSASNQSDTININVGRQFPQNKGQNPKTARAIKEKKASIDS